MESTKTKNPYIGPKWPGKLYRKIDVYDGAKYLGSSNAYATLKDARLGFAHALRIPPDMLRAHYDKTARG